MNEHFERLIVRAEALISRIESVLPQPLGAPDWAASVAYRYRKRSSGHGALEPVKNIGGMRLDDLKEIDDQKEKIKRNTEQFVSGKPANNVLLTGSRGTGKSSLIKACLNEYSARGLRLTEGIPDDVFALIRIAAVRPGNADFSCTVAGKARLDYPVFQVRFKNRSTTRHYFSRATGAPTATDPGPLPLTFAGNAGTKQKPPPEALKLAFDPVVAGRIVGIESNIFE
mgnify:CR=1 FL=1